MTKLEMPQQGGSHIRQRDGTLLRVAFTIGPGEVGHPEPAPEGPSPAPADPAAIPPSPEQPADPAQKES